MATYLTQPENSLSSQKQGSDVVRFGVIGYGYWGPNVVRNLDQLEQVDILAVCDLSAAARQRAQKAFPHLEVTSDPVALLSSPDIDAVAVVTPVWTHYELAKTALENGKARLCRKAVYQQLCASRRANRVGRQEESEDHGGPYLSVHRSG